MLVLVVSVCSAFAEDLRTIKMAAPGDGGKFSWPVLTSDGTGLYNKIYDSVFGFENIKVEIIIAPDLRCKAMVMDGDADFYPGEVKDFSYKGYAFVAPKYAIWHTKGVALVFKKTTIPHWEGINSLQGKKIVFLEGTAQIRELDQYRELSSEIKNAYAYPGDPVGALKMVMADRMEVFIASIELIKNVAIPALKEEFNDEEYQIEFLGRQKYYPLFRNTARGKQLAAIFDKGIRQLYQSGRLNTWFDNPIPGATLENIDPALMEK